MEITNTQARALRLPPAPPGTVAPPNRTLLPGLNTVSDSYWAECMRRSKSVRQWVELKWLVPGATLPDLRTATENPDGGPNPMKDGTLAEIQAKRAEEAKAAEAEAAKVTSYPSGGGKKK